MGMILMKASTRAYGRLNITLPRATVELLDRVTKRGNRSRFIDQVIRELALGRTRTRRTERSFEPHDCHHHRCSGDLARAVATLSERGARPCGRGRLPARLDRARPSDSLRRPCAPRPATRQTSPVDAGGGRPGILITLGIIDI